MRRVGEGGGIGEVGGITDELQPRVPTPMPTHLVAIAPSMISQRAVLGFDGIGSSKAAIITKSLATSRLASAMGNTS
jgi:hypothetical protein